MKTFLKEIQNSFDFLELEVDEETFSIMLVWLFDLWGRSRCKLITPEINLCNNGSIDISFRNKNGYRALINFHKPMKVTFYGDNGEGNDIIPFDKKNTLIDLEEWVLKNLTI